MNRRRKLWLSSGWALMLLSVTACDMSKVEAWFAPTRTLPDDSSVTFDNDHTPLFNPASPPPDNSRHVPEENVGASGAPQGMPQQQRYGAPPVMQPYTNGASAPITQPYGPPTGYGQAPAAPYVIPMNGSAPITQPYGPPTGYGQAPAAQSYSPAYGPPPAMQPYTPSGGYGPSQYGAPAGYGSPQSNNAPVVYAPRPQATAGWRRVPDENAQALGMNGAPVVADATPSYPDLATVPPRPPMPSSQDIRSNFNTLQTEQRSSESERRQFMQDQGATVMTSPQTGRLVPNPADAVPVNAGQGMPSSAMSPRRLEEPAIQNEQKDDSKPGGGHSGIGGWFHSLFAGDDAQQQPSAYSMRRAPVNNPIVSNPRSGRADFVTTTEPSGAAIIPPELPARHVDAADASGRKEFPAQIAPDTGYRRPSANPVSPVQEAVSGGNAMPVAVPDMAAARPRIVHEPDTMPTVQSNAAPAAVPDAAYTPSANAVPQNAEAAPDSARKHFAPVTQPDVAVAVPAPVNAVPHELGVVPEEQRIPAPAVVPDVASSAPVRAVHEQEAAPADQKAQAVPEVVVQEPGPSAPAKTVASAPEPAPAAEPAAVQPAPADVAVQEPAPAAPAKVDSVPQTASASGSSSDIVPAPDPVTMTNVAPNAPIDFPPPPKHVASEVTTYIVPEPTVASAPLPRTPVNAAPVQESVTVYNPPPDEAPPSQPAAIATARLPDTAASAQPRTLIDPAPIQQPVTVYNPPPNPAPASQAAAVTRLPDTAALVNQDEKPINLVQPSAPSDNSRNYLDDSRYADQHPQYRNY